MAQACQIRWLGQVAYNTAWQLQRELVMQRVAGKIPDTLLILEHPPTFTVGLEGHRQHLLPTQAELCQLGIALHHVDRSGPVMYHGPGQLVVYPILSLRDFGHTYHSYINALESVIIHTLRRFNVPAVRQLGHRGIWVLPGHTPYNTPKWVKSNNYIGQIGAVGVNIGPADITSHGFFINVAPDLKYFDLIVPSGIQTCKVTSLQEVLNRPVKIGMAVEPVIQSFCNIFQTKPAGLDGPAKIEESSAQPVGGFVPL